MPQQCGHREAKRARLHEDGRQPEEAAASGAEAAEATQDAAFDRPPITPLQRLCEPRASGGAGASKKDLNLLLQHGLQCVEGAAHTPLRRLKQIEGLSEDKARAISEAAGRMVGGRMVSALKMMQVRESVVRLTTGAGQIDGLLRGGVETGQITELFGESRSGKTQLCHTLCVTCQLGVDSGGAASKALYIDTEGTFRPERLQSIATRFGLKPEEALENVTYAQAYNTEHQSDLLAEAAALFSESRYALLVVDSATGLFRTEYSGRGELAERQQALNMFFRKLRLLADQYGVAVVVTNQVMASPDAAPAYMGPQVQPVGGHIVAHASQVRLSIRKGKGRNRICKVVDSPDAREAEVGFMISTGGIVDAEQ